MRMFFTIATVLIFSTQSFLIVAQHNSIVVKLTDNLTSEPLRDVVVSLNDSVTTKTNYGGYFEFSAASNDVVAVTADKYEPKIIKIPAGTRFQVRLDKQDMYLEFTDGVSRFYDYFKTNLRYPDKAINKEIQADIYIEFKIDSAGRSHLINVHNDELNIFTKSIERAFKNIPGSWSFSYSNKTFLLPVSFRINSDSKTLDKMKPRCDRILNTVIIGYFKFGN